MIRIAWLWLAAAGLLVSSAPIPAAADDTREANKKTVVEFYEAAINRKDFEAASKFFGPRYVQHNPMAPDGIEGFKAFLGFLREKFPQSRSEIKRVWAEGDYVILHGRFSGHGRPAAWIAADILRMEDGRLAEPWDVLQDEATKAESKSGLPMFGDRFPA